MLVCCVGAWRVGVGCRRAGVGEGLRGAEWSVL